MNDISSCKIGMENLQKFLADHNNKFTPEFYHKCQVDITLLRSRLGFVENYHKEIESISAELANNAFRTCHQCLQEADKILSEAIDTSTYSLAERHLVDLQVGDVLMVFS